MVVSRKMSQMVNGSYLLQAALCKIFSSLYMPVYSIISLMLLPVFYIEPKNNLFDRVLVAVQESSEPLV